MNSRLVANQHKPTVALKGLLCVMINFPLGYITSSNLNL